MKKLLTLFLVLLSVTLSAQRERNYIYVLDCTKSMIGYNGSPDIFRQTKDYLKKELEKQPKGTTLHVIPFQDKVFRSIDFRAEEFNTKKWQNIEEKIDKYVQKVTNTNICTAWDEACKYIDLDKDNYIILLTDGKDNVNGMDCVAEKLKQWCGKYPNSYAFYVQLTESAVDSGVKKVIDICDAEYIVDATIELPVFGGFIDNTVYSNTKELDTIHRLIFSTAGKYPSKAVCKDPYFDIEIVNNKIDNGVIPIKIIARNTEQIKSSLPTAYSFSFEVVSDSVTIVNPIIDVQMTNRPERTLDLDLKNTNIGKATRYDSFLWSKEKKPDTLNIYLNKVIFSEEAKKDGSFVELQFTDRDGNNDFQLIYKGKIINDGKITLESIDNDSNNDSVQLIFDSDAKKGKQYLTVKAISNYELDKINGKPVGQYQTLLLSEYTVKWNPLKKGIVISGILLLIALLVWFLLIKKLVYPTIKVKTIQINDPYFSIINIKGKRRVVFTNKDMKQSFFSKIFTGEILYKKHEIWTTPLVFEAGTRNRTLRVLRTKDYVLYPNASVLTAPNDYIIENINGNIKIKIFIN